MIRFRLPEPELRAAMRRAAAALWLPALLPFVIGPLRECDHCVQSYALAVPVLPGVLPALLLGGWGWVVAAVVTLSLFFGVTALMRVCGRHWPWGAMAVFGLIAVEALGFASLLRA